MPPAAALRPTALSLLLAAGVLGPQAPAQPRFESVQRPAEAGVALRIAAETGQRYRLESSSRLDDWTPVVTFAGAPTVELTDGSLPFGTARFYRVRQLEDPAALTGDHLTADASPITVHPVNHASLVVQWNGRTVYVDPVGGAAPYQGLPRADLILVTHSHGDHFHAATLDAVRTADATLVAPAAVYASLSTALRARTLPLANGASTNLFPGVSLDAVPAYNANHPKGAGNGYVLTLGGRRLYFSGDTGDIPEMRALSGIDAAFVCMNQPFTMTVAQAAAAVRAFRPGIVYPYHFRNQDGTLSNLGSFGTLVGADAGIEVRVRKWY